jgi:Anti-sigma-K factor rskA, C-terminal
VKEVHPDLAALLRGELGNAAACEAAVHARGCEGCRADLVDVALGHGLLTATRGTFGSDPVAETTAPVTDLPAELRRELGRRWWARPLVAAVAAFVLVVGAGVTAVLTGGEDRMDPALAAEQTATLEPVDPPAASSPGAGGQVSMAADRGLVTRMRVDTSDLRRAPRGEFYYVWLLDPRTDKMLPLGVVTPGRTARFDVPESLVEGYSAIDISLEADDGNPAHSVTSVLRASYATGSTGALGAPDPTHTTATPEETPPERNTP